VVPTWPLSAIDFSQLVEQRGIGRQAVMLVALIRNQWHQTIRNYCLRMGASREAGEKLISHVDRLLDQGLPIILDLNHFARLLGIPKHKMAAMIYRADRFYKHFSIKKRSGGAREISAPTIILKQCQKWILRNILEKPPVPGCVQGFVSKRSILTNAALHVGSQVVVNVDVKDFFPSIRWGQVFNLFRHLGYAKKVAFYLTKLTTLNGVLPQGAPTSPMISNHVAGHLDARLMGLTRREGCAYSRYADDLTFSGRSDVVSLLPLVDKILKEEGFALNKGKTRIMRSNRQQEVTGLVVNNKPAVKRSHRRWLRQQVYYFGRFGLDDCRARTRTIRKNARDFFYGHALFLRMVDRAKGNAVLEDLDSIDW